MSACDCLLVRNDGKQVTVDTLDERTLTVDISDVVSPAYTKIVRGEGMPKTKAPGEVCLSPPGDGVPCSDSHSSAREVRLDSGHAPYHVRDAIQRKKIYDTIQGSCGVGVEEPRRRNAGCLCFPRYWCIVTTSLLTHVCICVAAR